MSNKTLEERLVSTDGRKCSNGVEALRLHGVTNVAITHPSGVAIFLA